jgi:hypothetical protein
MKKSKESCKLIYKLIDLDLDLDLDLYIVVKCNRIGIIAFEKD